MIDRDPATFEDFREAIREGALEAIDAACDEYNLATVTDADLPSLFRALESLTRNLWDRAVAAEANG